MMSACGEPAAFASGMWDWADAAWGRAETPHLPRQGSCVVRAIGIGAHVARRSGNDQRWELCREGEQSGGAFWDALVTDMCELWSNVEVQVQMDITGDPLVRSAAHPA